MDSLCKVTACRSNSRQLGVCSHKLNLMVKNCKGMDISRCKLRTMANSLPEPRLTNISPSKATDSNQFRDMVSPCKATDSISNLCKVMECLSSSSLPWACNRRHMVRERPQQSEWQSV